MAAESEQAATRLEQQVLEHEQYRDQYRQTIGWVMTSRQHVTQLGDTSGYSKQQIEEKQQQLEVSCQLFQMSDCKQSYFSNIFLYIWSLFKYSPYSTSRKLYFSLNNRP